jgi:signal transduction histidine kinase/DNA-binding response OmpR family regulator
MDNSDIVNILIVDDLPEKILVLETVLEELGQNIVTARSGPEALRQVLTHDFAVILLDVNMPGMDGLETAALIRARKKSAHTPIIFITAFADEMHTARGYSLGAVDYILSPVVPDVLRTKVKVFVELFRMAQQVRQQADERVALAREQAARAAAEEATRRAGFLAEATTLLTNSLDFEATVASLLRLVVPNLADLAAVTLIGESGQATRTEWAWVCPPENIVHHGSAAAEVAHVDFQKALGRVLTSGKAEMLYGVEVNGPSAGCGAAGAESKTKASPPAEMKLHAAFLLSLRARGRSLGVLCLAQGESRRHLAPADKALAEDLAGRAAIALDNARLYREVREADRLKNEFLSMLAHELRNPLAPIRNAVHVLRMRGTSEPGLQAVRDIIDRQVQQLVRLVDDLLDISRITRGKIRLQKEPLELAAVVEQAVEMSRPVIDSKRHQFTVTLPREPVRVNGDAVRLAQVVGNLLNNAAKYTADGGAIALTLEHGEDEAVIRVRDNGIGIPTEMLGSIFDLFTQVERSLDRSQGGLGIGLTLVHRLVEMHGGRVQAFSAGANQGSEFIVRLPTMAAATPKKASTNGTAASPVQGPCCRVLVVDDNVDGADSLALLLRLGGHKVHVCHCGADALAAVDTFQPEIVLLDIGLPEMDGYEVARRLRALEGTQNILLVALTGYGQDRDIRRSREAGFDHHLVKPADPQALTELFSRIHATPPGV